MATLTALLTVPEAAALIEALGRYADAIEDGADDGPSRTRQQKMADCLVDLVLRPGETDLPVVQAQLTLVAPIPTMIGGGQPGEIGGEPVAAEMVRALAHGLGLVPAVSEFGARVPASTFAGPPADVCTEDDAEDAARAEALERWWAEVDAQALRGEWGGEVQPLEELERLWALEAERACRPEFRNLTDGWYGPVAVDRAAAPGAVVTQRSVADPATADAFTPDAAPQTEPRWWLAADRAVDEAGAALLDLDRGLARARRAVEPR
jgi:hypothetical protein